MDLLEVQDEDTKKEILKIKKNLEKKGVDKQAITDLLYWQTPPTIKEFLTKKYIGTLEYMLYPKWKNVLINEIFNRGSVANEVVLGGSTGSGKTTIALICQMFNLLKVLSYHTPQTIFGVPDTSVLSIVFISIFDIYTSNL